MCRLRSQPSMKSMIFISLPVFLMAGLAGGVGNFRFSSTLMTVQEGESVNMECRFSRKTDDRYLIWGSVPPGSRVIKQLVYWSPGSQVPTFTTGEPHRYVAEKNFAQSLMSLRIINATQRDSTRYFCQFTNHQGDLNATDWCGCGSTLKVEAVPPMATPSVHLQFPPPEEISENGFTALLCLVTGFYPSRVRISWYVNGKPVTSGTSELCLSKDPTERYTAIGRLEVSGPEWVSADTYQCVVSHQTLTRPIAKEIRTSARYPSAPRLHILPPSYSEMDTNGTATLGCQADGFYPKSISFTWLVGTLQPTYSSEAGRTTRHENGTYSSSNWLTVPVREWNSGSLFTCRVEHLSSPTPLTHNLSKHDVPSPQPPSIFLHHPPADETRTPGLTQLLCGATGFYPGVISLSWEVDGQKVSLGLSDSDPSLAPDGSYTLISRLDVTISEWEAGSLYSCVVSHRSLPVPVRRQIRGGALPPSPPSLHLVPPSIREILTNRTATLACIATEFYPATISFEWRVGGSEMAHGLRTLPLAANPGGTFSSRSELTVPVERWESGESFTCLVRHQSLGSPVTSTVANGDTQRLKCPEIVTMEVDWQRVTATAGTTHLACFVFGFYPGDVYLTWRAEGIEVTNSTMTFPVIPDQGGTFRTVSQLSVPSEDWEGGRVYSCLVGHQSSKVLMESHLSKDGALPPSPPSLHLVPPSIREILTNRTATLACIATEFYPATISFEWRVGGSEMAHGLRTLPLAANPGGTFSSRSELTVPVERWESGESFTCLVRHQSLGSPVTSTVANGDTQRLKCPEIVTMEVDWQRVTATAGTTHLACFVFGFYPGDVYLTWRAEGIEVTNSTMTFPVIPDQGGTFRTVSQLSVPSEDWEGGRVYSCLVGHQSSKVLMESHLSKDGGPWTWRGKIQLAAWLWVLCAVGGLVIYTVIILAIYQGLRTCSRKGQCNISGTGDTLWAKGGIQLDVVRPLDQNGVQSNVM
ncbi:uncharacterized protein [Heptranchias perlo]|uniref:uncharacterized protein n=1 Tax=Heptranchias perlo TaxID=212740 RepID=UPI0035599267